ncbi:MAG: glycosyltransferase involved in cell wall biosynthesis [Marivirga sp.]
MNSPPLISVVAPMYNEEEVVETFFSVIKETMENANLNYEIICINDGSSDRTINLLREASFKDKRIKVVNLSRNYGKEIALTAGLDHVVGDAAIPIDCDLQDPPHIILELVKKWQEGFDVVLAKRIDRSSDSLTKRVTSSMFYKLIDIISETKIPNNVGDFRLMDRRVIEALSGYREKTRFMKGIFASLGFNQVTIEYVREERVAGQAKLNYFKLYKLALEGIISFTSLPLKIWSYVGLMVSFFAFSYGFYLIFRTLVYGVDSPGYASTMVVVLFMSGLILVCLGTLGEYVSRIFVETKQRPMYIVMEKIGFKKDE